MGKASTRFRMGILWKYLVWISLFYQYYGTRFFVKSSFTRIFLASSSRFKQSMGWKTSKLFFVVLIIIFIRFPSNITLIYVWKSYGHILIDSGHRVDLEQMMYWEYQSKRSEFFYWDFVIIATFRLPLAMYNRWNLYEAMKVDEYFACLTKNWSQRGEQNTKALLSKMG